MQLQRSQNTEPELRLRKSLHKRGLRYRLHQGIVPGTKRRVDVVFRTARVAVDVRGCYWHGHAHEFEAYRRKHNLDYWQPKIVGNQRRDADTEHRLAETGWLLIVVWACEDVEAAAQRIEAAVRARRQ
jgi:DNA mismatch endonuclease (patch repair protein)